MNAIVNEVRTENGDLLRLTYELLRDETAQTYGVRLQEKRICPERIVEIPNITANVLEMERLIMVLSTCSVTSSTIHDILDDYRAEAQSKNK